MSWKARLHPDQPVIEFSVLGLLTLPEINAAALEVRALALKQGITRILVDFSNLDPGHSVVDLLFLTDSFEAANKLGPFEKAVLLPSHPADAARIEFWKTACATRKLHVRLFDDRQPALDWLLK